MRALVIGDTILDIYVRIVKAKQVQEIPQRGSAFDLGDKTYRLGGAAHVAQQLVTLGCETVLVTALGDDVVAKKLLTTNKISYVDVSKDPVGCVSHKTRLYTTNKVTRQRELVMRFDEDRCPECDLGKLLDSFIKLFDLVVISDYNKGVLKKGIPHNIQCPFVICSPKDSNLLKYRNVSYFVMNTKELTEYVGENWLGLGDSGVVVTYGAVGATLQEKASIDTDPLLVPAPNTCVQDVTGAGDVLLAVFSNGLVRGVAPLEALKTAVAAASKSCMTFGTSLVEGVEYDQT